MWGGDQADQLWGGADNDTIRGGAASDTIFADAGNDRIFGDDQTDTYRFKGLTAVTGGANAWDTAGVSLTLGNHLLRATATPQCIWSSSRRSGVATKLRCLFLCKVKMSLGGF